MKLKCPKKENRSTDQHTNMKNQGCIQKLQGKLKNKIKTE